MLKLETKRVALKLFALLIFILCIGTAFRSLPSNYAQQPHGKLITREPVHRNEPVRITDLKIGGKNTTFDTASDNGDDWLKATTFKLTNVSHKNIIYVVIELSFPDSKATGAMMVHDLYFGQRPGKTLPARPPLLLKQGESIEVSIEPEYDRIKRFLKEDRP